MSCELWGVPAGVKCSFFRRVAEFAHLSNLNEKVCKNCKTCRFCKFSYNVRKFHIQRRAKLQIVAKNIQSSKKGHGAHINFYFMVIVEWCGVGCFWAVPS